MTKYNKEEINFKDIFIGIIIVTYNPNIDGFFENLEI